MLARAERDRRLDQVGEAAQWVAAPARPFDYGRKVFGDALVDDRPGQLSLGGKSAVERSFPHAGAASDGVHRRVRSEFGIDLTGGAQDAFGVARSVGA